jgi:hypothetical protein
MASKLVDLVAAPDRSCGECTLCCRLMGVEELEKPNDKWCVHCKGGCQVYNVRPQTCRDFTCLWLAGALRIEDRPDKTGVVCVPQDEGKTVVMHVRDEPLRNSTQQVVNRLARNWIIKGLRVILVKGKKQVMLGVR